MFIDSIKGEYLPITQQGGWDMEDVEFNAILDQSAGLLDALRIEKLQYVMDFGDVSVQYDFCLN